MTTVMARLDKRLGIAPIFILQTLHGYAKRVYYLANKFCVTDLPRRELSVMLRGCKDERKLQTWLAEEVKAGCLCCALMVHARLSAVRRRRELQELKAAVVVNQMTEATYGRDDEVKP